MRKRLSVRLSVSGEEEGDVAPRPPARRGRLRRVLLWLLYGVGAAVMVLVLTPWLGLWRALPVGAAAFAVYLMLPTYRDRR